MKLKALQIFKTFFIVFLITACSSSQTPKQSPPPKDSPSKQDQDETEDRDTRRHRDTRRSRYSDQDSQECNTSTKCKKKCDDIFRSRKYRLECEELSVATVEQMEDLFEDLKDADTDDLEVLDQDILKSFLDISLDPLKRIIGDLSDTKKKKFLIWFAEDSDSAELIIDAEEEEFEILTTLFERIVVSPWRHSGLHQNVRGTENFIEVILEEDNEPILEWLHSYFEDNPCERYRGQYDTYYGRKIDLHSFCVFDIYCGLDISSDAEQKYLDYEFFRKVLDEALSYARQQNLAPSWWTEDMEADSLESWSSSPNDMCREGLSFYGFS